MKTSYRPTKVTVSLKDLRHNFKCLQSFFGADVPIMAAVKADAYGHGLVEVASTLQAVGCKNFGVALVEEGEVLRKAGIRGQILCLGGVHKGAEEALALDLTPVVFDLEGAELLNTIGVARGKPVQVHLKVDTGMGRLGVQLGEWVAFVNHIAVLTHLDVVGLFSHCSNADFPDETLTLEQHEAFLKAVKQAKQAGLAPQCMHLANSAAAIRFPQMRHDMVRVGIAMFGVAPIENCPIELRPVMAVQTEVLAVKEIPPQTGLSYGRRWKSDKSARIATLPVGYADGYLRALSNNAEVLIGGHRCPVRGSICMDMMMVDVTDCPVVVEKGTEVILLGGGLLASELALWAGTIPYEILTGLSGRIERSFQGHAKSL
jgi:alanine racemase